MSGLALSETVSHIDQLLPLTRNAFTAAIASNRCAHLAIPINVQMESIEARTHFCLGSDKLVCKCNFDKYKLINP
jgi:hypothetical protein